MPLTDTAIRSAKPDTKPRKLTDGNGLYLLLNPNGSRWWRFDYRYHGKRIDLLTAIRRIEQRGAIETAHRALRLCGQIFRYVIATGRAERDISQDLRGALPPVKAKHFSALTEPAKVAQLLTTLESYSGTFVVRLAP